MPRSHPQPVHFAALDQKEKTAPPAKKNPRAAEEWEEEEELENIRKKKRKKPAASTDQVKTYLPPKQQGPTRTFREMSPVPSVSFNALDDNGLAIPPDAHGVAGLNHLMVALNSEFRILSKTGSVVNTVSAAGFWNGVTPGGFADPHVLYDHFTNRWILVGQSDASNSALLLAVSQNEDPTGTWLRYAIDVDETNEFWFDFPLIGFNGNWLVVTGNLFNSTGSWSGKSQIYIFEKQALYSGASVNLGTNAQAITSATTDYAYSLSPATSYDNSNSMFLVESWDDQKGQLRLSGLQGTLPNVTWTVNTATFPANGSQSWRWAPNPGGDFAPQKGDSRKIAVNDDRMNNVILRNGKLWMAHHVFLPGNSTTTRAAIQWWVIDTASGMPLQIGLIDDPSGKITRTFPSVAVDAAENMVVGYSLFSATTYASAAYAFRSACTPVGTMQSEVIYKAGLAPYYKNFGGSRCRWGDYSNTCLDPATGKFWTIQEYAAQKANNTDNGSRWGTWWAEITPEEGNSVYFGKLVGTLTEETAGMTECRGYKDYSIIIGVACKATGNATVHFTTAGTATRGIDYDLLPSTVSFTAGESSKTVTLRVYNDQALEDTEVIELGFTISGSGVVAGSAGQVQTITLTDNDQAPLASDNFTLTTGDGSTSLSGSSFFQSAFTRAKYQYLILASELTAKGLSAGTIHGLAFNVVQRGTSGNFTFNGLTISLAATTATTVNPPVTAGLAQVYSGNYTIKNAGLQSFPLATPFTWDGSSNLVVQVCFDNEGVTPGAGAEVLSGVSSVAGAGTPTMFARNTTAPPTPDGCSLTFNTVSGFRPDITFLASSAGTGIAAALNTTYETYLGPYADVCVYSPSGEIIARIKNKTNFDYGCTKVTIDRAGTGSVRFWNEDPPAYLASKTVLLRPSKNNPTGSYDITLYYTREEVEGWQTATGNSWTQAKMVKTPDSVNRVTPTRPTSGIEVNAGSVPMPFGKHYSLSASFNTGFSGFGAGVPGGSTLPVTLVDFSGRNLSGGVELIWRTSLEYLHDRYEVERSNNGATFSRIGQVSGQRTSFAPKDYRFFDSQPLAGTNYYRLKQIDKNGSVSYSKTVTVLFAANGQSVVIYPNPANERLTLSFANPQSDVHMNLFSIDGRLLRSQVLGPAERTKIVGVSALPNGTYMLEFRLGSQKQTFTFIKE